MHINILGKLVQCRGEKMAKPIDFGLILEDEDAINFWKNEKTKVTKAEQEMLREAKKICSTHRF